MTKPQMDYERLRLEMVEGQLRSRGIRDERVLHVMQRVPRHLFVSEDYRAEAYEDKPVPIPCDQTISQPYMVAVMTELLELSSGSSVLEVGTGSGYQAAVLGCLAKTVVTIERHEPLAVFARKHLRALSLENVDVRVGDGTLGAPDEAPFDGIIVTAGGPEVPRALMKQLAIGGRMVCPVGNRRDQELIVVTRNAEGFEQTTNTRCRFVPLIGEEGWEE